MIMFRKNASFKRGQKLVPGFLPLAIFAIILLLLTSSISCRTIVSNSDVQSFGPSVPGPSAEEEGGEGSPPSGTSSFAGHLVQNPLLPLAEPLPDWLPDGIVTPGEYSDIARFDDVTIYWRTYYEYFYCAVKIAETGWSAISIGQQPDHGFENADVILGFVASGQANVFDMFSNGSSGPFIKDTDLGGFNNIFDSGAKQDGGFTTIEFKRALGTGDKYDRNVSFPNTNILLAYGTGSQAPDAAMIQKAVKTSFQIRIFYYEPPEHVC